MEVVQSFPAHGSGVNPIAAIVDDGDYRGYLVSPSAYSAAAAAVETAPVMLPPGYELQLLPSTDPNRRVVVNIAGRSGCGKSVFAREYMEKYADMYPERPQYIISRVADDPSLPEVGEFGQAHTADGETLPNPFRINPDKLLGNPIDWATELTNCLVLFDDVDTLDKGGVAAAVRKLIAEVLKLGRHTGTTMVYCGHRLNDYSRTRDIIDEADYHVIFPSHTSMHQLKYFLSTIGFGPGAISDIANSGQLRVVIKATAPMLWFGRDVALNVSRF